MDEKVISPSGTPKEEEQVQVIDQAFKRREKSSVRIPRTRGEGGGVNPSRILQQQEHGLSNPAEDMGSEFAAEFLKSARLMDERMKEAQRIGEQQQKQGRIICVLKAVPWEIKLAGALLATGVGLYLGYSALSFFGVLGSSYRDSGIPQITFQDGLEDEVVGPL